MGSKYTPYINLLSGLLVTLLVIWLIFVHSINEFNAVYHEKSQAVFSSSRDIFLQHRIMLDALQSFFHASKEISPVEFEIFAKDLLKIKSGVAFTLTPELKLAYISDPTILPELGLLKLVKTAHDELHAQSADYTLAFVKIDEPHMPYLVYAISHQDILARIEQEQGICAIYQFEHSLLRSSSCQSPPATGIWRLFVYSDSLFVDLTDKARLNLQVTYQVPRAEVIEHMVIILLIALLGLAFSVLWFFKAKNQQIVQRIQCENRSKLAVLASINHEIRTPISVILGYSKVLKSALSQNLLQVPMPQKASLLELNTIVDKMIWSTNLLYSVAENTLNYSKSEVGKLSLNLTSVNLREYINQIQEYYQTFNAVSGKSLRVIVSDTLPEDLELDETKLFQLITNIINNAFKYSTGDQVHCYMDMHFISNQGVMSPMLRVLIRDFGEGMSKKAKRVLDDPFIYDSNTSANGISGMGLGLYTCKRLLEQIGGKLRLRSQLGSGTWVLLHFPCRLNTPVVLTERYGQQQHILLVDDNLFNLEICRYALEPHFTHIQSSDNAKEALKIFCSQPQHIVLVDYRLKDIDGLALIQQMQQILKDMTDWKCHFFLLSANDSHEIPNLELFPEVVFMKKPFSVEEFFSKLPVTSKV